MEKTFIVLGADIVGFSLPSERHQKLIKDKFNSVLTSYLETNRKVICIPTGDGFYLGYDSEIFEPSFPFYLIANMIEIFEECKFRFVVSAGNAKITKEINKSKSIQGDILTETRRLLDSFSGDCTILLSTDFCKKFLSNSPITSCKLDEAITLNVLKTFEFKDKHNNLRKAFNISFVKDNIEYGYDIETCCLETFEKFPQFESKYYEELLKTAFPRKKIENIKSEMQVQKSIVYSLFKVTYSEFLSEHFLFLGNDINKTSTLNHFNNENKIDTPLKICSNKKFYDDSRNDYYKNDLLRKWSQINKNVTQWKFIFLDEFIFNNCLKDEDEIDRDLFREDENYVNPLSELEGHVEKISDKVYVVKYLKEWIESGQFPIFIITGEAGIGKTTVLKRLSNYLIREFQLRSVIFINPTLLIEEIKKNDLNWLKKIRTIYDLLEIYFEVDKKKDQSNILRNKFILDFVISSGNLILIIDGLDELIASFKDDFDLTEFLNDIIHINSLLNKTKIIISTRSYFWNDVFENRLAEAVLQKFAVLKLKGFNINLAIEYFNSKFDNNSTKVNKAVEILRSICRSEFDEYSPFIVYLVADMITRSDFDVGPIINDSKYLNLSISFDQVISHILKREQKRQSLNVETDEFLEFFYEIIVNKSNKMSLSEFKYYADVMLPKVENKVNMLSNSLLSIERGIISINHDYLWEHFVIIFLSFGILNNRNDFSLISLISTFFSGKTELLYNLIKRLECDNQFYQKIKAYFSITLETLRTSQESKSKLIAEKAISSLLYLIMNSSKFGTRNSREDRTKILKDLYNNKFENLHIYGNFVSLDFRGIKIYKSSFFDYDNFLLSMFDKETKFIECKFNYNKMKVLNIIKKTELTMDNFDTSCSFKETLNTLIDHDFDANKAILELISFDLTEFLKKMYKKNRFIPAHRTELNIQYSSSLDSHVFFKALKEFKILIEDSKRDHFSVGNEYKESVEQLLNNNYRDSNIDKLISRIYSISIK